MHLLSRELQWLPYWFNSEQPLYIFPGGSVIKSPPCQAGNGFDPWVGKIPWRRNSNSLRYSCLENSMDRGAWWVTVHGVANSWDTASRLNNKKFMDCHRGLRETPPASSGQKRPRKKGSRVSKQLVENFTRKENKKMGWKLEWHLKMTNICIILRLHTRIFAI